MRSTAYHAAYDQCDKNYIMLLLIVHMPQALNPDPRLVGLDVSFGVLQPLARLRLQRERALFSEILYLLLLTLSYVNLIRVVCLVKEGVVAAARSCTMCFVAFVLSQT